MVRCCCGYGSAIRTLAVLLLTVHSAAGQSLATAGAGAREAWVNLPEAPLPAQVATEKESVATASVSGVVVDAAGGLLAGAQIELWTEGSGARVLQRTTADGNGGFQMTGVAAGTFVLRVEATGFAEGQFSVVLSDGEQRQMDELKLQVAGVITDIDVTLTRDEIAQEQIKQQEKQRVFGVIPNFYVSYEKDPVPLSTRQKYALAWRAIIDPTTFLFTGIAAGVEQGTETFPGYGQGAAGYGRRYGAGIGDTVSGAMLGGAILPSLLKQDPRYFYQGTGGFRSRAWHAVSRSVLCRGDNGKTQVDYSGILGGLASAGISNLYYPATDRNGAGLTFENLAIGVGSSAAANMFQEFVVKRLSRGVPKGANGSGP